MAIPARVERQIDGGAGGAHLDASGPQHAVALDQHQRLAVVRRREVRLHRVAGAEGRTFQTDLHAVGPVAERLVALRAPAGVEAVTHRQPVLRVVDFQPVTAPGDREGELALRLQRNGAAVDQFVGVAEAGVPAALVIETPVVLPFFLEQPHVGLVERGRRAVGQEAADLEFGQRRFARHVGVEQRTHADQRGRRPPGALQRAHHRPAAGFEQAQAGAQAQRRARGTRVVRHRQLCRTAVVERGFFQLAPALERVVGEVAEDETGLLRQRKAQALGGECAEQAVAGGRRAEQVVALHGDVERRAIGQHTLRTGQRQLHALGQELLDLETHDRVRPFCSGIGAQFQRPGAGLGVGGYRQRVPEVTGLFARRLPHALTDGAPVGALEQHAERLRSHRFAIGVARQHRHVEAFARPVQVAPAPHEQLVVRRQQARGVEFGQVERSFAQRYDRQLAAAPRDHQPGIGRYGVEGGTAVAFGLDRGDALAVAVQHFELDAVERRARAQRRGEGIDAAAVAVQVQTDVADVEIGGLIIAGKAARHVHHRDIHARLAQFLDVLDRQEAHVPAVALVVGLEAAQIDAGRQVLQLVDVPAGGAAAQVDGAAVVVLAFVFPFALALRRILVGAAADAIHLVEEGRQLGRLDAQELHVDFGRVDGDDRQAAVLPGRQHGAAAGEEERRRHVFDQGFALVGTGELIAGA